MSLEGGCGVPASDLLRAEFHSGDREKPSLLSSGGFSKPIGQAAARRSTDTLPPRSGLRVSASSGCDTGENGSLK